jgi:hypothetical protein
MYILPKTIDEVVDHLEKIVSDSTKHNNRTGYFATLYLSVTKEIRDNINKGHFENNQLIEQLDVVFANRFLEAYYKHNDDETVTKSWEIVFSSAMFWKPLVIQHLFLGMNAHIGLDLGIAAATVSPGESIGRLQSDFYKVNSILSSMINSVQENLANIWPLLKLIDRLAGRLDEALAKFSIEIARDAAWKVALEYSKFKNKEEQNHYIQIRDEEVAKFSSKLLRPGLQLRVLIIIIRIGESGTIKSKIRKLTS